MDIEIPAWALPLFLQLWSFFAVAAIVYQLGKVSKAIAGARGWRGPGKVYDLTLRLHPIFAGFVLGFVPFPTLHAIESIDSIPRMVVTRCLWFALAGTLCGQLYEFAKFAKLWFEVRLGLKRASVAQAEVEAEDARPTSTPPAAGEDA